MVRRIFTTRFALIAGLLTGGAVAPAQVTSRISVDSNGVEADAASWGGALSHDGRFVLFHSGATNLVPNDTNGFDDVFVHDLLTGITERVNVDSLGNEAIGDRCAIDNWTCISADGRYVSFYGWASNLAPGVDDNTTEDVFVHDRLTGITEAIDVTPAGVVTGNGATGGSMSADGRFVTFTSGGWDLVPGLHPAYQQTWVRDRLNGTTEIVSVDSNGNMANDSSGYWGQYLSPDGRFVCFGSQATNLVPGVTSGMHIYLHDRQTGTTELVDIDPTGAPGDRAADPGPISADGRYVAFTSAASNLVQPDNNGHESDAYVRDRLTGVTELVDVSSNGVQGNSGGGVGGISADGRFVAFSSGSTNLVPGDTNGKTDSFLHDRLTGKTTRTDLGPGGKQSNGGRWDAGISWGISGDGRMVAFIGAGDDLVGGDTNGVEDVFVHGADLTLEAEPTTTGAGATVTLTEWRGKPAALNMLVLTGIDGVPMFTPLLIGSFDSSGVWTYSDTVPPGLSGSTWTLQDFGVVATGKVRASNGVAITFQ